MMDYQMHILSPLMRGDTWQGLTFQIVLNEVPLDLTGGEIRMHLRKTRKGELIAEWDTAQGTITILDPNELIPVTGGGTAPRGHGWATILGRRMEVPAANYWYDIEITFPSGRRLTPVLGRWRIIQDTTYNSP